MATLEHRVPIVAASEQISEEKARDLISRRDKARDDYFSKFFKVNADDAIHYDMVLSTERIGHDKATSIIINAAQA